MQRIPSSVSSILPPPPRVLGLQDTSGSVMQVSKAGKGQSKDSDPRMPGPEWLLSLLLSADLLLLTTPCTRNSGRKRKVG